MITAPGGALRYEERRASRPPRWEPLTERHLSDALLDGRNRWTGLSFNGASALTS